MAAGDKQRVFSNAPKVGTAIARMKACSQGIRRAWVDIDDPVQRSAELRRWIQLAHTVSERKELEEENRKLRESLDRRSAALERQSVAYANPSGAEARAEATPPAGPEHLQ